MKLRDGLLAMVVVAGASLAGCAVCDTCDDFPVPCTGPNCGGMVGGGMGAPVMGSSAPTYGPMDDSAGAGPMVPPASPAIDPTSPPATMAPAAG